MEDWMNQALTGGWGRLPDPEVPRSMKTGGNENWKQVGGGGGTGCGRGDGAVVGWKQSIVR